MITLSLRIRYFHIQLFFHYFRIQVICGSQFVFISVKFTDILCDYALHDQYMIELDSVSVISCQCIIGRLEKKIVKPGIGNGTVFGFYASCPSTIDLI